MIVAMQQAQMHCVFWYLIGSIAYFSCLTLYTTALKPLGVLNFVADQCISPAHTADP